MCASLSRAVKQPTETPDRRGDYPPAQREHRRADVARHVVIDENEQRQRYLSGQRAELDRTAVVSFI